MLRGPVTHAYNPSHSERSKFEASRRKHFERTYLEKTHHTHTHTHTHTHKRAGGVAQGVGPEFKLQYCKKKECFIAFFYIAQLTSNSQSSCLSLPNIGIKVMHHYAKNSFELWPIKYQKKRAKLLA
jgi:hypothetical protein